MREIYLAGGCYWGAEKYLASLKGVAETEVGFANGTAVSPSYEQVKHGGTGHAETVRVRYDETVIPLPSLLRLFFRLFLAVCCRHGFRLAFIVWRHQRSALSGGRWRFFLLFRSVLRFRLRVRCAFVCRRPFCLQVHSVCN